MIIAQVCLRLATIKGHSKMCSFIAQHNSTDVASLRERAIGSAIHPRPSPHVAAWLCTAPCCKDLYTIPGSWKHPSSCMASILTGHVTHWACLGCSGSAYTTACSSSCKYPATSHSHWRGVGQHSTGHNQQPDQLYAKEMCCTAWGKWWSHQILTGFQTPPDPPNAVKLHILLWPA